MATIEQLQATKQEAQDRLARAVEGLDVERQRFREGKISQKSFSNAERSVDRLRDSVISTVRKADIDINNIKILAAGGSIERQKRAVFKGPSRRPTYLKPPPPSEARFYEQVESERYGTIYVPKERVDVEARAEERVPLGVESVRLPSIDLAARRTPIERVGLLTEEERVRFLRETGQRVEPIAVSPGALRLFEERKEERAEIRTREAEEKRRKRIAKTPIRELIEPGREAVGVSIKQAFANLERELKAKTESLFGTKEKPRPIVGEVKTGELLVTRDVTAKGRTLRQITKEVTAPGKVLFPQIPEITREIAGGLKFVTKDIPIAGFKAIRFATGPEGRKIIGETAVKGYRVVKEDPVAAAKIAAAVTVIKGGEVLVATAAELGRRPFGFATEAALIGVGIRGAGIITKAGVRGVGKVPSVISKAVGKIKVTIPKTITKPTITKARIEITAPVKKPSITIISAGIPSKEFRLMLGIVPGKKISVTQAITRRAFAPELVTRKPLVKFSIERIVGKIGPPGRIPIFKELRLKTGLFDIRFATLKPGQIQRLIGARPVKRPRLIDILLRKPLITETGNIVGLKLVGFRLKTVSIVPLPPHLKKMFKPITIIKKPKKLKPFKPMIPKGFIEAPVGEQVLLQKLKPPKLKVVTKQKVIARQKAIQRQVQMQMPKQVTLQQLTMFPRLRTVTAQEQRQRARQLLFPMLRFKQVQEVAMLPITKQAVIQKAALVPELISLTALKPTLIPKQVQAAIQGVSVVDTRQLLKAVPKPKPRLVPTLKFPLISRRKRKKVKKRIKRATRYNPNLGAIIDSVTGKRPVTLTGLETRPVPSRRLRKRKKRR